ncbi:MAG: hypothetical protein HC838_03960 [Spirulinaceae cyanobacterium RM2_2_10]|nr:hypothetical protein [Spirulinaceae cyanobacterium SM2_1_0]NJO19391.1 hypothetical protein [Spirulinaceae cyanobacterium RM2_2_10]
MAHGQGQALTAPVQAGEAETSTAPEPARVLFWQRATPIERAQDFRAWVLQLPTTQSSLPDEAFDRGSIYEQ